MPLSSARPSLAPSVTGSRPCETKATLAGTRPCGVKHSPTPIITAVMCDSGARSPDAPTEPCAGTTGMTSFASIASSSATVSGRTPDAPCARLASFSAIISRAIATGIGSPTPAAWRKHDVALQGFEVGGRNAHAGELAEAGVDAVDRLALGDDARDGGRTCRDLRLAGRVERRHGAAIDGAPVGKRGVAGFQNECGHRPLQTRECSGLNPMR